MHFIGGKFEDLPEKLEENIELTIGRGYEDKNKFLKVQVVGCHDNGDTIFTTEEIYQEYFAGCAYVVTPTKGNEQDKKLFAQMETSIKNGADFIFCDLRKNSRANVTVEIFPIPGAKLQNISDTELRLEIKNMFQAHMNFNTEIYEIKRTIFAGTPCVTVYLSHDAETRGYNYVFLQKHRCISISLFSHRLAFREKLAVFQAVLKTLKFHK